MQRNVSAGLIATTLIPLQNLYFKNKDRRTVAGANRQKTG